jgi:hypothetical protein
MALTANSPLAFPDYLLDGSKRLRTATPTTLGDYRIRNSDPANYLLNYTGTGTVTQNVSSVTLSVTSGQYYIVNSKIYHPKLNEKSQLIQVDLLQFGNATNVEKSVGYISSSSTAPYNTGLDGFRFIKNLNDTKEVQIWRNGSQLSTPSLQQGNWVDKLDGTGASGANINWANFQVLAFELANDNLFCSIMVNGKFQIFAVYYNSNVSATTLLLSANKPLRWEIRSSTGSGSLEVSEGSVSMKGTLDESDFLGISLKSTNNGLILPLVSTSYALVAVRKKSSARDRYAFIHTFEGTIKTNDFIDISIILNPTVSGTFTFSDIPNTPLQSAVGTALNTVTGGTVLDSTYASLNMNNAKNPTPNALTKLGSTLLDGMDTIVLVGIPSMASTNVTIMGNMNVKWII